MKLQTTFECDVTVRATWDEAGKVRVTVVGVAPYAETRDKDGKPTGHVTAATTVEVTDAALADPVAAALAAVAKAAPALLGPAVARSVHQAQAVAAARGELNAPPKAGG